MLENELEEKYKRIQNSWNTEGRYDSLRQHYKTFDALHGSTTTHYPLVPDVNGLVVVGSEGAVWAATDDGLYIINPEAMAAIE